jgi:hypothetical protein
MLLDFIVELFPFLDEHYTVIETVLSQVTVDVHFEFLEVLVLDDDIPRRRRNRVHKLEVIDN